MQAAMMPSWTSNSRQYQFGMPPQVKSFGRDWKFSTVRTMQHAPVLFPVSQSLRVHYSARGSPHHTETHQHREANLGTEPHLQLPQD